MPSTGAEGVHHFGCTQCGECCRGWRLPLSMTEAMDWAEAGHGVEFLCQATPCPSEPNEGHGAAWNTSFPAFSGSVPVRITMVLTADLKDACPHLMEDMGCAAYARRPLACRIYPAGLDPLAPWHPSLKRCPENAWDRNHPVLYRDGFCADDSYQQYRRAYRAAAQTDAAIHSRLCAALGVHHAALNGEGAVIHRPRGSDLLSALHGTRSPSPATEESGGDWVIVSENPAVVDALLRVRAVGMHAHETDGGSQGWEYQGFIKR